MRTAQLVAAVSFGFAILLAASSWATSVDYFAPPIGGENGVPFTVRCKYGYYLAGLEVRHGDWIDGVAMVCRKWDDKSQTLGPGYTGSMFGGPGGVPGAAVCNADEAVGGIVGQPSKNLEPGSGYPASDRQNNFLGFLSVACRKLKSYDALMRRHANTFGKAPPRYGLREGSRCDPDSIAIGIHGASDRYVDRLGLICVAIPKPVDKTTTQVTKETRVTQSNEPKPKEKGEQRSPTHGTTAVVAVETGPVQPSPSFGDFQPYGLIGEKYAKLGGADGPLGAPIDAEKDARHGGRCHAFRHGTICWHVEIGEPFVVWGQIHDKWRQLNRVDYGYPITDERTASDGRGRFNHFRAMHLPGRPVGSIYWTPQTGAHAIWGLIRDAWAQQGWERGPLGYPTSDEYQDGKFRRSNFERGHILWAPDTGIQIVR